MYFLCSSIVRTLSNCVLTKIIQQKIILQRGGTYRSARKKQTEILGRQSPPHLKYKLTNKTHAYVCGLVVPPCCMRARSFIELKAVGLRTHC